MKFTISFSAFINHFIEVINSFIIYVTCIKSYFTDDRIIYICSQQLVLCHTNNDYKLNLNNSIISKVNYNTSYTFDDLNMTHNFFLSLHLHNCNDYCISAMELSKNNWD